MKVVFLGPSAPGSAALPKFASIEFRPPAGRGDVVAAVLDGATVIGLVDGVFEQVPAVWHKELLFALSRGVQLFGAASMGALRAAECAAFGMIGVGTIFRAFAEGDLADDDAVAVVHGPREMDYLPFSVPLVNAEATLAALDERGLLHPAEFRSLVAAARNTFFKDRTYPTILQAAEIATLARREEIGASIARFAVDVKRTDALALLEAVRAAADELVPPPAGWQFNATSEWRSLLSAMERDRAPA